MLEQAERYSYPLWFRTLYGLPAIVAVGPIFVVLLLLLLRTHVTIALIIVFVVIQIALVYVGERLWYSKVPTLITVGNGVVSLYRFGRRTDFHLSSVLSVDTGGASPFFSYIGGAARVTYNANGRTRVFYIASYISSYARLVVLLSENVVQHGPAEGTRVFFFRPSAVWYFRSGSLFWGALVVGVGLWGMIHWRPHSIVVPIVLICAGLHIWFSWNNACTFAIRVEFRDDTAVITPLFGGRITISRSEVISLEECDRGSRYKILCWKGVTLRLRMGRSFHIDPVFVDYQLLVRELDRWGQH